MKYILISCLIATLGVLVLTDPIARIPESDLMVGTLGPDDELSYRATNITRKPGTDGIIMTYSNPSLNVTYVTAQEAGEYPDATATLVMGGPGYDSTTVEILPGLSGNFNYILEIWGTYDQTKIGPVSFVTFKYL